MRILALRGENLASLRAPFEVDFEAEPLARAGVFAICGPTGAGKSTLLDAICLALFHTTPRLEAVSGHGADIPDTGDKTITSKDPRNMLSRGAGHGYAEVDFVGLDGRPWRARWEVHRARQKATGLLQQPKASLTALDDGTVVASQLREVQTRIGERIGLDFGQFTRAVMLPQNGFAEFLKAPERERADLLSALTGGEIYGRISKLAWDRADGFVKREQEIETRLGYEPPLNDLARADLEAREAAAAAELQTLDARLTTLTTALAWYGKEAELTAAAEAKAKAAAEHDERATDEAETRRNLRRDERLAALRPRHDEMATLRDRRRELAEGAPARQAALGAAEAAHAAALALEQKAKADAQAARERRDAARPLRDRVRKLDEALTAATTGKLAAVDAHADAEEARDAAAAAHAETAETLAAATAEAGRWPAWQAAHPALPADAKRWTKLGADLDTAAEEAAQHEACDAELQTLAERAQSGTDAVEVARAKVAEAETAEQAAIAALAAAEAALPADESAALATRRDALATRRAGLEALSRLSADRERLRGEVEAAGLEVADLEGRHLAAATAAAKAEAALPALLAEHETARHAHDRTRLTADEHTQALRATLVAGDPCPVCGSTEHPAAGDDLGALTAVLGKLAKAEQAAEAALRQAQGARDQHSASAAALVEARAGARARLAKAEEALQKLERELIAGVVALGKRAKAIARALAALPELRGAIEAEADELAKAESALRQAEDALRKATEARNKAGAKATAAREALTKAQEAADAPLAARREAEARRKEADKRLTRALKALAGPLDRSVDPTELPDLRALWRAGEAVRVAAAEAEDRRKLLATRAEAEAKVLNAAADKAAKQADALRKAETALAAAQTARRAALPEPDVEAWWQALEDAVEAADQAVAAAVAAVAEAAAGLQRAKDADAQAAHAIGELDPQIARTAKSLVEAGAKLARDLGLPEPDAAQIDAWLAALPADLDARLAALRTAEEARRDARRDADAAARALAEFRAEPAPAEPRDALDAAAADVRAARDAQAEARGGLRQQLVDDDAKRAKSSEGRAEIERLRAEALPWRQIAELIGQADGAKFRRQAAHYALEVLLERANVELAGLADRYRLEPGPTELSLLVVDRDLGDERRSAHSLSGGESFLVSLALALGLASLSAERVRVESLFIDEGFGALDADTLTLAMSALDRLHADGRRVGVISHVHEMAERIGVQIRVTPQGAGRSEVAVVG